MAVPTIVGVGALSPGITAPTLIALPAGIQANDILVAYAETSGNTTVSVDQGYAQVADSPQLQGTSTAVHVYWKRATGADTGPTFTQDLNANHIVGQIIAVRGCVASGDPWDVTAGSTDAVSSTSAVAPTDTTTVAEALVLAACATGWDAAIAQASGFSAPNLANVALTGINGGTANGGGGTISVASGELAAAGSLGVMTFTLANSTSKALHTLALKPVVGGGGGGGGGVGRRVALLLS
jgi:hypothetical protein